MSVQKWNSLIKKQLSYIVHNEIKNKYVNSITIVDLELSLDYDTAKIFYHTKYKLEETEINLKKIIPVIRKKLSNHLSLKRIPKLIFIYDDTLEKGNKINKIIDSF